MQRDLFGDDAGNGRKVEGQNCPLNSIEEAAELDPEPVSPAIASWVGEWQSLPEAARRDALGELVGHLDSVGRLAMRNLLRTRKRVTGNTRI